MRLTVDTPAGDPSFSLEDDEIETVIDLICKGAREARQHLTSGLLEVPITIIVRKAMKRIKRELGLTNLEVSGEVEIDDMSSEGAEIAGRIDITLKFLRQFGNEEDYVGVECKRVGAGSAYNQLNTRYVTQGVLRFTNGQYAVGHAWGFMLGYALSLPGEQIVNVVNQRLQQVYGGSAALAGAGSHEHAISIHEGQLQQASGAPIRLCHILVDMVPAAATAI
ncbi:hypothetical protein NKL07_00115 [Mesorhizobium sp. C280B]|uniref:hypothetical protein n=1 Tax=unclassified Mesorhizobium TaxID=325217 RepID=UPI0003CDF6C2|nr:hypothetical protein [Mesorhizobium sp. LSJC280B00]ESW74492.1 hypothetical protein X772_32940 [Mesorhizobium sp. LSJC280B00]